MGICKNKCYRFPTFFFNIFWFAERIFEFVLNHFLICRGFWRLVRVCRGGRWVWWGCLGVLAGAIASLSLLLCWFVLIKMALYRFFIASRPGLGLGRANGGWAWRLSLLYRLSCVVFFQSRWCFIASLSLLGVLLRLSRAAICTPRPTFVFFSVF